MLKKNVLKQFVFYGLMAACVSVSHCLFLSGTAMADDALPPTLFLDTTFSNDGIQTVDITNNDLGADVAIGQNGTVIVAGTSDMLINPNESAFVVSRFLSNGLPDSSFGTEGQASTVMPGNEIRVSKVVQQPDGKILVTGSTGSYGDTEITVIRYTATGELDATFSTDGIKTFPNIGTMSRASGIALQDDGKIILAGDCLRGGNYDFCMIRLHENGSVDINFGTNGITYLDTLEYDVCHTLALQNDGKILLAGSTGPTPSGGNMIVTRYTSSGQLDESFGHVGKNIKDTDSFGAIYALDIQSDEKIVAVGEANGLIIARYNIRGQLDSSFDSDGISTLNGAEGGRDVAIQKDGKIIIVSTREGGLESDLQIGRILPSGDADTEFSSGGIAMYNLGSDNTRASGVAIQPNGNILVAGSIEIDTSWDMLLIRLREQSTPSIVPIVSLLLGD